MIKIKIKVLKRDKKKHYFIQMQIIAYISIKYKYFFKGRVNSIKVNYKLLKMMFHKRSFNN